MYPFSRNRDGITRRNLQTDNQMPFGNLNASSEMKSDWFRSRGTEIIKAGPIAKRMQLYAPQRFGICPNGHYALLLDLVIWRRRLPHNVIVNCIQRARFSGTLRTLRKRSADRFDIS